MTIPYLFASVSSATGAQLDANFQAVGIMGTFPCTVTGTNTLVLAAGPNTPALAAYSNYLKFSFIAANANTGAATARVGSLSALSVYKDTSAGPAALVAGDIIANNAYTLTYDSTLNSGAGGFHISSGAGSVTSVALSVANASYLTVSGSPIVDSGTITISMAKQAKNTFLLGPSTGVDDYPSFRTIATADLSPIAGQFPGTTTNNDATAGNVGEYLTANLASGSAISLTSGTVGTVTSLNLTPGDWDVWMEGLFTGGTTTTVSLMAMSLATVGTISTVTGFFNNVIGAGATMFNYGGPVSNNVGPSRFTVNATLSTLTVYGLAQATFGVSTCSAYGFLRARRVR